MRLLHFVCQLLEHLARLASLRLTFDLIHSLLLLGNLLLKFVVLRSLILELRLESFNLFGLP